MIDPRLGATYASSCTAAPSLHTHTARLATLAQHAQRDYYALLSVHPSASTAQMKQAYHHALLLTHPDKLPRSPDASAPPTPPDSADIGLLKEAYATLASPVLRTAYDAARTRAKTLQTGPRPAQVVSLEDFDESEDSEIAAWSYACRCGGKYIIGEREMDADQHLVGCNSCSEVVWVGYELAEETDHYVQK